MTAAIAALCRPMKHYTPAGWIAGAVLQNGVYWRKADGENVTIEVPAGEPWRLYGLRGSASGSITVTGDGDGDAWRDGDGDGHAWRGGDGDGDAWRDGDGDGRAWRGGDGDGDARRDGGGTGDAWRRGDGDGDARRDGGGTGDAWRDGDGKGRARRDGNGEGVERDARGTRFNIAPPDGISYRCSAGDGHLRVGCELHSLAEWVERANEIDGDHNDEGLADLTRALAQRLIAEGERKEIDP